MYSQNLIKVSITNHTNYYQNISYKNFVQIYQNNDFFNSQEEIYYDKLYYNYNCSQDLLMGH